jgi:hypothetical protein
MKGSGATVMAVITHHGKCYDATWSLPRASALRVLFREKAGSAARRRRIRTVRLNLTRSGSMSASVAAVQIRALMA